MGASVQARVVGALSAVVGGLSVALALVWMNSGGVDLSTEQVTGETAFDVPRPPPPKPKQEQKKKKARKRSNKAPPPAALLTAGLSGLDVGLPGFDASALEGTAGDLLGEERDVVMTEDTVDQPPRPVQQVAPSYPAKARSRNVEGSVTLAVLVREDGAVGDVRVLSSEPQGVFEQSAMAAVRAWRFEPAMYQGEPVALRLQIVMPFRLE